MSKPIEPYIHKCYPKNGDSIHHHTVNTYDIEYAYVCSECGELLVTHAQLLAHIYSELLGE